MKASESVPITFSIEVEPFVEMVPESALEDPWADALPEVLAFELPQPASEAASRAHTAAPAKILPIRLNFMTFLSIFRRMLCTCLCFVLSFAVLFLT